MTGAEIASLPFGLLEIFFLIRAFPLVRCADRRLRQRGRLYAAAGTTSYSFMCAFGQFRPGVYFGAAATAFLLWRWWNDGGGDGFKRRLQSWAPARMRLSY